MYTWQRNRENLEHFDKYNYDFDYCLASCASLKFSRELLLDNMFYGMVFPHKISNEWRVIILEDFLPDKFRAIGLVHEGYHLKQRIAGRSISDDLEEKEALCEEMRVATLEGLVEEYINWTRSILPSRVVKLRKALESNNRKRK